MTDVIKLEMAKRERVGRNAARRLRKEQRVPATLYGHGQPPVSLAAERRALASAIAHHARFVELAVDGTVETAIVREVQYDVYGQEILHVDFLRVNVDEKTEISVPLEFIGQPKGASEGGVLERFLNDVTIRCTPREMPESITVNVGDLGLHDQITVGDLPLPAGAEPVDDREKVVCAVVSGAAAEPEPTGEAAAEPEVLKRDEGKKAE